MATIDVRTRSDGPAPTPDAERFFGQALPAAFASSRGALRAAVDYLNPEPLLVRVDDRAWWLCTQGHEPVVEPTGVPPSPDDSPGGDPTGRPRLELTLDPDQLGDLVEDQVTPMGLFSSGQLRLGGGKGNGLASLLDWWLLVRGALDGTRPYVPGTGLPPGLAALVGEPDGLQRRFDVESPDDELRRFLTTTGFLHMRGVFSETEMAAIDADMDRCAPGYSPGDGRSWWAGTRDGEQRLVRMQRFDQRSPATAALLADGRLARIARLTGDGHRISPTEDNRIEALVKPIGVVQGISDVPWHKDCSLGRHSYECCSLTVGISVTGADPSSGQLRVVAGSHHATIWPALWREGVDLPMVDLPTERGDVTVHLSCTLHMAQPPVVRERRVMYTSFSLPPREPTCSGAETTELGEVDPGDPRQRLRAVRESAATTVSQPAAPA